MHTKKVKKQMDERKEKKRKIINTKTQAETLPARCTFCESNSDKYQHSAQKNQLTDESSRVHFPVV